MLLANCDVCLFPSQLLRTFYFLWSQDSTADNLNNLKLLRFSWYDLHTDFQNIHTSHCVNLAMKFHQTLCVLQYSILFFLGNILRIFLVADEQANSVRGQGQHTARCKFYSSVPLNLTLNYLKPDTSWCLKLVHSPWPDTVTTVVKQTMQNV